jgi:hypothetical protein
MLVPQNITKRVYEAVEQSVAATRSDLYFPVLRYDWLVLKIPESRECYGCNTFSLCIHQRGLQQQLQALLEIDVILLLSTRHLE